jgi:hypothetical protein
MNTQETIDTATARAQQAGASIKAKALAFASSPVGIVTAIVVGSIAINAASTAIGIELSDALSFDSFSDPVVA